MATFVRILTPADVNDNHAKALNLYSQGKLNEAKEILLNIYQRGERLINQRTVADTLFHIADAYLLNLNDHKKAYEIYHPILKDENVLEATDEYLISVWHDYALSSVICGNKKKAAEILKEVVKKRTALFGPENENTVIAKISLASTLRVNENYLEALEFYNDLYNISLKQLGKNDIKTIDLRNSVAEMYYDSGNNHEAIRFFEPVIEKFKKLPEYKNSKTLYQAQLKFASAYSRINDWKMSMEINREIYSKQLITKGPYLHEMLEALFGLVNLLIKYNIYDHAIELYKDIFEGYKIIYGPKHQKTLEIEKKKNLIKNKTIHFLAKEGNVTMLQFPVRMDPNLVNKQDEFKNTPLHYAVENNQGNAIKYLLESGAIYNIINNENKNPLQLANSPTIKDLLNSIEKLFKSVQDDDYEQVTKLIKNKTIINSKDAHGNSPLHWAVNNKNKNITILLLKNGADIFQKTSKGNTALHIASSKGFKEIVEILLKQVAKNKINSFLNARTAGGNSALHASSKQGFFDIVKILLENGAYYNLENREGETALDVSKNENITELLKLVEKCFDNVKTCNLDITNQLKNIKPEQLEILKKACNIYGKSLIQEAMACKSKNIVNELRKMF